MNYPLVPHSYPPPTSKLRQEDYFPQPHQRAHLYTSGASKCPKLLHLLLSSSSTAFISSFSEKTSGEITSPKAPHNILVLSQENVTQEVLGNGALKLSEEEAWNQLFYITEEGYTYEEVFLKGRTTPCSRPLGSWPVKQESQNILRTTQSPGTLKTTSDYLRDVCTYQNDGLRCSSSLKVLKHKTHSLFLPTEDLEIYSRVCSYLRESRTTFPFEFTRRETLT